MMTKKQKFFKNLLTSVSVASIVASIGGSNVAFAVDFDVDVGGNLSAISDDLVRAGNPAIINNDMAVFNDDADIRNLRVDILDAISIRAPHAGTVTIDRDNFTITAITGNAGNIAITVNDAKGLTLTGNNEALRAVTLNGANAHLIATGIIPGTIDGAGAGEGILTFAGAGTVTGTIGATNALATVNFGIAVGQPNEGGGVVQLGGAAIATGFNINHAKAHVIATGLMTGTVTFNATGKLVALGGIVGNVDFHGNAGTIILGADQTITGAVDNTDGAGGAAVANAGILNFVGAGTVTRAIGATKALAEVNFKGAGAVNLGDVANAAIFNIANAKANVTAADLMKGTVTFSKAGKLTANGGITGNVDFHGNAGTITLGNGQTITGAVDNTDGKGAAAGDVAGILNFAGAGTVTQAIGATKALAKVNFKGAGDVHLRQAAKARTFTFNEVATLHAHDNITGNVHFNGHNGTINLADGKTIDGSITTKGGGEGILNFEEAGTVTGDIGAIDPDEPALNKLIHQINIKAAGKNVILRQNVYTDELNFVDNSTVKIGGNFVGRVRGVGGGVDFTAGGGVLEFNGADGPAGEIISRLFDSKIQNGANGTLNVNTSILVATNAQIGNIKTINIGDAVGGAKVLAIDASAADVILLGRVNPAVGVAVNQKINFIHANSILGLGTIRRDSIITFNANLSGGIPNAHGVIAGDGGIVWLSGADTDLHTLTVRSATGAETLGVVGHKLDELRISHRVTIAGEDHVNKLGVQNANKLTIIHGAEFTDKSTTSAQIANIHIGADDGFGAGIGPATYILDAKHRNFELNADNANQIVFDHADAQLTLRNSADANRTITLVNDLDLGAGAGADGKGIVELHSAVNGRTLTIDGAATSLGTGGNNLKKVIFSGAGKFDTRQITIHSKNIELNVNELTLGAINSNILFATNTVLTAEGHITGNVDFQNHDGTVSLANGKNINGSVTSTGTGDAKGTLVFLGIGEVTDPITKLKMLRAGAGEVKLAGGNYNITEIQGNGNNNLIFANNFNLEGSINSTGGAAVGLIFKGNNRVTGVVGTAKNPVGTIQVQAGTNIFSNTVQTANDKDIIISKEATAKFANSVTTRNIKGELTGKGTVQFSNAEAITVNSAIGATNAVYTLDIAGADVKITQAVSANYIDFSNASKEATLTLEGTSTVGGIRTNGNNVHTLELAADFTTEIQDIGSENNRLKSIKLLGDHKITINSGVYSDISTKTDNTGKVVFNSDRSFAYNLGTDKLRLSDVTFANNATVKGDVYSKQITIASDKTATFAGTINRTISVPNLTVDRSSLSRSLRSFAYSTQIVSDEIKNEGIAKFDKAVLIDAKITGGKVTFADNVWFKQTADGKEVNFAANKYVILEQNINFANIKADQAKIIILPKTASITGNLAAKDFTVDLAANQLKYTGQAQLTGKIELVTAYDTSSGAGGNIEVQTGSKLDLSKADELTIKVKAQTDINKIPKEGAKYVVISSVNGNGLVAIDNSKIKLDPTGEQNRFVQWSMDSSDLTLYITDISKEVIAKEIADKSTSQEEREFYTQLNNVTDRNSSAAQFMNNIGRMDREHALQAMDRILPSNEHPIGESLVRNPTSEIIGGLIAQADTQITATRMGNSVPMQNAASAVDSENATSAIGSGDDDTLRYGVWGSPFYGTACQETYKGVSGYKSKSAGGIVGFDGLVNDNLLLGAAYSRINTQMSHQDKKIGDKTNGKTNIFSLYSLYNLTNNWFTEAIASYGITRVKNSEGRLIATTKRNVTALETAAAKYKSISYSGQLLTGYNYIASEKLMITPTIGFRYSQFKDAGYTETGTKFQNLVVKKRSYNKFEGILGLRTAATLKANKVLLIPELHGYVNHDFKGKAPIIDARLDGINEPLPTKSVKPVKTFFTVGTGFTAKYNMMECGIIYNVNIASKYIGHQGSLKVKVNF